MCTLLCFFDLLFLIYAEIYRYACFLKIKYVQFYVLPFTFNNSQKYHDTDLLWRLDQKERGLDLDTLIYRKFVHHMDKSVRENTFPWSNIV